MPREHLGHIRTGHAATPCPKLVADVSFIMPLAIMPPGHNAIVCAARVLTPRARTACVPGRTIRNAGPACRTGALKPRTPRAVIRATCQRSEHRPVKISTFRPLLIRRPLRRPSPLIAMRSDFERMNESSVLTFGGQPLGERGRFPCFTRISNGNNRENVD